MLYLRAVVASARAGEHTTRGEDWRSARITETLNMVWEEMENKRPGLITPRAHVRSSADSGMMTTNHINHPRERGALITWMCCEGVLGVLP